MQGRVADIDEALALAGARPDRGATPAQRAGDWIGQLALFAVSALIVALLAGLVLVIFASKP